VNGDPGLATERTQLAWQRYAFGVAVVAVLSLRAGLTGKDRVLGFVIAFLLAAIAATLQVAGPRMEPRMAVRVALAASLVAAAGALLLALL
jgi:uncharacterized membrane protein YidH (DUF202 family)